MLTSLFSHHRRRLTSASCQRLRPTACAISHLQARRGYMAPLSQDGTPLTMPDIHRIPLNFSGTQYGGRYTVTLIPGDGIGKELADAVQDVFKFANVPIDWETIHVSGYDMKPDMVAHAIASLKRNKVGLKGTLYTPAEAGSFTSLNVAIRRDMDLFASVALCKNMPGYMGCRHQDVDFCIVRENTEGEYSGLEHQSYPGVVESLKVITRKKSERIARFAFDFALRNGRKKVTCVHKANIMKLADGLFLNTCRAVAKEYADTGIAFEDMIVDNTAMQLVSKPQQFDVIVLPNLYGSIVSNIGGGLIGSPGLLPGCALGREAAIFEPGCRHVGKDIEGQNAANPTAMLLSAGLLLDHLGLHGQSAWLTQAVYAVHADGKVRTPDMKGTATTTDFVTAVKGKMEEAAAVATTA